MRLYTINQNSAIFSLSTVYPITLPSLLVFLPPFLLFLIKSVLLVPCLPAFSPYLFPYLLPSLHLFTMYGPIHFDVSLLLYFPLISSPLLTSPLFFLSTPLFSSPLRLLIFISFFALYNQCDRSKILLRLRFFYFPDEKSVLCIVLDKRFQLYVDYFLVCMIHSLFLFI